MTSMNDAPVVSEQARSRADMGGFSPTPTRVLLAEQILQSRIAHYDALLESWKRIEAKAQGVGALAGGFVAAVFSFIRDVEVSTSLPQRWTMAVALLLLAVCVLFAVLALTVRSLPARPLEEMVTSLADLQVLDDAELAERRRIFFVEAARAWAEPCTALSSVNKTRASFVRAAQVLLATAIGVVVGLSIWLLVSP